MKLFISLLIALAGCSHKPTQSTTSSTTSTAPQEMPLPFLKECSQIRVIDSNNWLLTCQKPPHEDRTEIYEWSLENQKLKRLTYQDGQIWDIMPIDSEHFYYSSSYDEFKEQFASILSGAKPGSDIYLKDLTHTDFHRITSTKGLEISLFWEPQTKKLYFIHEGDTQSEIMTLDRRHKLKTLYKTSHRPIRNPIYIPKSHQLYWLEYESIDKRPDIRMMDAKGNLTTLYHSESKIFQISLSPNGQQLMVGFVTGLGVEIWSLHLEDNCWRLAYRSTEPISEFYMLDDQTLFLTIRNSLKKDSLLPSSEICYPSPPALGVQTL